MKDKFFLHVSNLYHRTLCQLLQNSNELQIIKNYQKNIENIVQSGNEYISLSFIKKYYDSIATENNFITQNDSFWDYIFDIFEANNSYVLTNKNELIQELILESITDSEVRYQINLNSPEESFLLLNFYKINLIESKADCSKISLIDNLINIFSQFCDMKFLKLLNHSK